MPAWYRAGSQPTCPRSSLPLYHSPTDDSPAHHTSSPTIMPAVLSASPPGRISAHAPAPASPPAHRLTSSPLSPAYPPVSPRAGLPPPSSYARLSACPLAHRSTCFVRSSTYPQVNLAARPPACRSTSPPARPTGWASTRPSSALACPARLSRPLIRSASLARLHVPLVCPARLPRPPTSHVCQLIFPPSTCKSAPSRQSVHSPTRLSTHQPNCSSADPLIHRLLVHKCACTPSPSRSQICPIVFKIK